MFLVERFYTKIMAGIELLNQKKLFALAINATLTVWQREGSPLTASMMHKNQIII